MLKNLLIEFVFSFCVCGSFLMGCCVAVGFWKFDFFKFPKFWGK